MKALLSLVIITLFATPIFADQALVLTEIEQIQEKIWYLQRDVAAQKSALEKHQKSIKDAVATGEEQYKATEQRLDALAKLLNSQQERAKQIEDKLQSLQEAVSALVNEFNQQNAAQLQQAEKTGTQEGLLQALRDEVVASREKTEKALAKTEAQLAETSAQLVALQERKGNSFDQMGLYLGGAALALAILLTFAFVFLNSKSNRSNRARETRPNHEL